MSVAQILLFKNTQPSNNLNESARLKQLYRDKPVYLLHNNG